MGRLATVYALVVLLVASACGDDEGELLVDLKTDLAPVAEFDAVRTDLVGAGSAVHEVTTSLPYVDGVRIAELAISPGSYVLRVRLSSAGTTVVERTILLDAGAERRAVTVVVTRDCLGIRCPGASDPPDASTCLGGVCVDPRCSPDDLTSCGPGECAAHADCPEMSACATPRCLVENVCFYETDDGACGASEICHATRGCIPAPTSPPDGGPPPDDGGLDTMVPVPDGCVPSTEDCNGEDDDCDGIVDEGASARCGTIPSTKFECVAGACVPFCEAPQADCDGVPDNGCEANLESATDCGFCGRACSMTCISGSCLPGGTAPIAIAAYEQGTCALRGNGSVACWGFDGNGENGDGSPGVERGTAADVVGLPPAERVEGGALHNCALAAGQAWCWGSNTYGQLGDGTTMDRSRPVQNPYRGVVDIALGDRHTCILRSSGEVHCWGRNDHGQLGQGTVGGMEMFSELSVPIGAAMDVDTTLGSHTCALLATGNVSCWGRNDFGQLGRGAAGMSSGSPMDVGTLTAIGGLALGEDHACAWNAAGTTVRCWGANGGLQIDDTGMVSPTPVTVSPGGSVSEMALGLGHTCARLAGGTVSCWGSNSSGQLGRAPIGGSSGAPQVVSGVSSATSVTAGALHTCVIDGGIARCWGSNTHGRLGAGLGGPDSATPVTVMGL